MMKRKLAVVSILSLMSTATLADDSPYFQLLVGQAEQTEDLGAGEEPSGDDVSFGLRLGVELNQYLAAELGYHNFGEADITRGGGGINETLETTSINLGLKGRVPLNDKFALEARVGAFRWDYEFEATVGAFTFSGDDTGTDFYYGLGASIQLTDSIGLGAEYTVYNHEANIEGFEFDRDLDNLALSLSWSL